MWDHYDLFRPPNNTQTNLSNILFYQHPIIQNTLETKDQVLAKQNYSPIQTQTFSPCLLSLINHKR